MATFHFLFPCALNAVVQGILLFQSYKHLYNYHQLSSVQCRYLEYLLGMLDRVKQNFCSNLAEFVFGHGPCLSICPPCTWRSCSTHLNTTTFGSLQTSQGLECSIPMSAMSAITACSYVQNFLLRVALNSGRLTWSYMFRIIFEVHDSTGLHGMCYIGRIYSSSKLLIHPRRMRGLNHALVPHAAINSYQPLDFAFTIGYMAITMVISYIVVRPQFPRGTYRNKCLFRSLL